MVVALVALVFSLAGTGVAARYLITSSAQVKNGVLNGADVRNSSLTGADVKNRSLTAADFSGSVQGPAGAAGPAGPQGAQGPKGDRGVSAWETIPSGVTVTGSEATATPVGGTDALHIQTVDLGARAPAALTDATVNVAAPAPTLFKPDGDASCAGSVAAPTAPPGKVCVYLESSANVEDIEGAAQAAGADLSFNVRLRSTTTGPTRWSLTWAYTAP